MCARVYGLTRVYAGCVDKIRHHLRPGCYVGLRKLPCQQRRRYRRGGILRQRLHRHCHRQLLALWRVHHGCDLRSYVPMKESPPLDACARLLISAQ